MLNIEKNIDNGKAVFRLEGRLDTISSPDLDEEVTGAIDGLSELVLDCEGLEYVSSAGLRVILGAYKKIAGNGTMTLRNVRQEIMDILDTTGFSDFLDIDNGEEEETEGEE